MLPAILIGFIIMVAFPVVWMWIMRAVIVCIGVLLFREIHKTRHGSSRRVFSIGPLGLVILLVWSIIWIAYLVKLGAKGRWIEIALTAPVLLMLATLFLLNLKPPKVPHGEERNAPRD